MTDRIKKYKLSLIKALKNCGIPDNLSARCFSIYFILSSAHILNARQNGIDALNMWQEFIQTISPKNDVICFIILFCFISLLFYYFSAKSKAIPDLMDPVLLIAGTLLFSCSLMWRNNDFYLCIGVCLTTVPFIIYAASKLKEKYLNNISSKAIAITTVLLSVIVIGFICITAVAMHWQFMTSCFDMGIFLQMYRSMVHNLTAVTTCERDMLLSHFNIHASYIYYLLVPVYALFPGANTLIIAQVIISVSGIIPMFLIAKKRNLTGIALLSACIIYLFSSGLLAPSYYPIHENAFLPPLLMWLMYAVEKRNYLLFFIMSALVCIVKEDAPIYVLCIALYLAIDEKSKDRIHALVVILLSLAYFLFITNWLTANGDGSMMLSSRFSHLTINEDDGFVDIIKNILSNPGYFFSQFLQEDTFLFFLKILLPLAFFPFISKKIHRFLFIIPFVMMNLVPGVIYEPATYLFYQYSYGPTALLIYLAIINISDFDTRKRNISIITTAVLSVITAFSLIGVYFNYYEHYIEYEEVFKDMETCFNAIPEDAVVISYTNFLPHVADRDEVYLFNEEDFELDKDAIIGLKDLEKYDFYILFLPDENTAPAIYYIENAGYTVFRESANLIIYISPDYVMDP